MNSHVAFKVLDQENLNSDNVRKQQQNKDEL